MFSMAEECSVCLTALAAETHLTTPCNHSFHKKCLRRWIRRRPICPLCRQMFNGVDIAVISGRSASDTERRASRQLSENLAREEFRNATVCFLYMPGAWSVSAAIWLIHTEPGTSNWMPQHWVDYYQTRRGQTLEAYRLCNQQGVSCILRSRGGAPPRRLFYCRICKRHTYAEYSLLAQHYALEHAELNTPRLQFIYETFI